MPKITALLTAALRRGDRIRRPAKLPPTPRSSSTAPSWSTPTDFEGNMLRIPESRRDEVRMSYDRVATIVDNMFIARSLAARAREAGLDKDPAVQKRLQQVQDGVLADLYVQKVEKEVPRANLDAARARTLPGRTSRSTSPRKRCTCSRSS